MAVLLALRDTGKSIRVKVEGIWNRLGSNSLWKRMLRNIVATTVVVGISLIHEPDSPFGKGAYLAAMTTVFAHPGRRFGQLVEQLSLAVLGAFIGAAWSILGVYLGSFIIHRNKLAAYAIRAIFLLAILLLHGFLRSHTPRLWSFILLLIIVCLTGFTTTSSYVTQIFATQLLYPVIMAAGVILAVNVCVFPEFSSSFLGKTTMDTLTEATRALTNAGQYFVEQDTQTDSNTKVKMISLRDLTVAKAKLRSKLASCQTLQNECQFEVAFAVLPPRYLRIVSKEAMKKLVANAIAIIGACESRYALLGEAKISKDRSHGPDKEIFQTDLSREEAQDTIDISQPLSGGLMDRDGSFEYDLDLVKPRREIEWGDIELLRHLLNSVRQPYMDLQRKYLETVDIVNSCVAFAYNVPFLPSGSRAPKGILLEELDLHIDIIYHALQQFDEDSAFVLDGAASLHCSKDEEIDVMPREEVFLVSSFLLNVRQATVHLIEMMKQSRFLIEKRNDRNNRKRLYAPHIRWRKWLYSGSQEDEALPQSGRKAVRNGIVEENPDDDIKAEQIGANESRSFRKRKLKQDLERAAGMGNFETQLNQEPPDADLLARALDDSQRKMNLKLWSSSIREKSADAIEWMQDSEDFAYAVKLSIGVFLVTWPAFLPSLNSLYSLYRGTWAALQLIFILEVAIGTSITTFFLRGIGTTLGSLWGWAAFEARHGNPYVCVALIAIGLVPGTYVQLGTKQAKAGAVSIVSMCVVAVSTELKSVPGGGTDNFLKRWIAFMIGGIVALLVELTLLPVKARTRLVESLAASIKQISEMEGCIAFGIEEGSNISEFPPNVLARFEIASGRAKGALGAAETFLPFCNTEPRLKGPFSSLAPIYTEILFVLHQIVDRMDNMLQLRTAYGSGPLEEFNAQIYPYRRNVAGSVTLALFAVHEALTTRLPLPQFLPSARLAHLRMINKVREVVLENAEIANSRQNLNDEVQQRCIRQKYMSWNASSAALGEVIEYLEELIDLTKLLVGANEFRSGLLIRPTYQEYKKYVKKDSHSGSSQPSSAITDVVHDSSAKPDILRRRRGTSSVQNSIEREEEVPISLRRIQSRKTNASFGKRNTRESFGKRNTRESFM